MTKYQLATYRYQKISSFSKYTGYAGFVFTQNINNNNNNNIIIIIIIIMRSDIQEQINFVLVYIKAGIEGAVHACLICLIVISLLMMDGVYCWWMHLMPLTHLIALPCY